MATLKEQRVNWLRSQQLSRLNPNTQPVLVAEIPQDIESDIDISAEIFGDHVGDMEEYSPIRLQVLEGRIKTPDLFRGHPLADKTFIHVYKLRTLDPTLWPVQDEPQAISAHPSPLDIFSRYITLGPNDLAQVEITVRLKTDPITHEFTDKLETIGQIVAWDVPPEDHLHKIFPDPHGSATPRNRDRDTTVIKFDPTNITFDPDKQDRLKKALLLITPNIYKAHPHGNIDQSRPSNVIELAPPTHAQLIADTRNNKRAA